ncbi:MAG: AmmeMemoRadiSam system protein B [Candidatus Omnitrophota bacterium]
MKRLKIRRPVVAGQFYPSTAQEINEQISSFVDSNAQKENALACMLPHAGYLYSGKVAAQTISRINLRNRIILLGPNHTGKGEAFSIMTEGLWQTPLGDIEIDSVLAKDLLNNSNFLKDDALAHTDEHSLEVELPILQYFKADFKIIPIAFRGEDPDTLKKIGTELAALLKKKDNLDSTLIVASSDMTHYEPQEDAKRKDNEAIQAILALNEDKLLERIVNLNISMCGYAPVIAMLTAVKLLGAKEAKLISYQTSASVTKDNESVVGYAGIVIN